MPRTPEQVEADDALTAAIEQVIRVYYAGEDAYVLSEYVVITCQQRYDDDGDGITAIGTMYRDGDVPPHRALGLLEYARARLKKTICDDGDA
jgi:hypothetical protein